MDLTNLGVVFGGIGAAVGIFGGMFGTYYSVKRTDGPKERWFMIKMSILCWIGVVVFLLALFNVPRGYIALCWIVYAAALGSFIFLVNRGQARIYAKESRAKREAEATGTKLEENSF